MRGDRYSRIVALLKVVLPLMALALLSTLFLLSRRIDPTASIPFADTEVQDRLSGQQVTGPYFAGTTANGDRLSFAADTLTSPQGQTGGHDARQVIAQVDLVTGAQINLKSDLGKFDLGRDVTSLSGNVVVTTSTGYRIETDALQTKMSELDIRTPGEIRANSPIGTVTAGQMHLYSPAPNDPAQLIFTNGVKLIYVPKQVKE